jgi:ketosteroid isomerase-like protein
MKVPLPLTLVGLAIGFAVPSIAQEQSAVDPEVRQQIEAAFRKYSEAFNQHDAAAMATLFAVDAVQVLDWGEGGMFSGQQVIEKNYAVLMVPLFLALKAEALHLADRASEALQVIREAEALAEKFEGRWWSAELHRLRGVFLAAVGAEQTEIEASFREAIRTAKQQKSISLAMRAEASYAEYRSRKGERWHVFR